MFFRSEMDMWSLSPDTRKVWNANGLEVDEPLSLWDAVPEEDPPRRRTILKVETEEALRAAERACSVISKRGKLENLDLKDTKPMQVDDDRPYRTWYPVLSSKRIPAKEIVVCKPNQRAARDERKPAEDGYFVRSRCPTSCDGAHTEKL
ncbi:hypothetical protein ANCCAN_18268 [Ancylostoma caninum]|uniref:Uncharacterized protein n=1 Tax=Ancylostoma caninum TaxID=29170 RepID=A0A368FXZ4_ANCCA|nr:hypothetical protein ANCCAN_18268 [Ancylostoma caninum]